MIEKHRYARLVVGIIVFGSVWGLLECTVGDSLTGSGLPSGAIMTGVFGFGIMAISRMIYQQRGMQLGIGIVAGSLKFLHPIGGCMLCSAIAIAAEGVLFEIIWMNPRLQPQRLNQTLTISMGIISGFVLYSIGYFATQVFTPLVSNAPLSLAILPSLIPSTLSTATLAGLASATILVIIRTIPTDMATRLLTSPKEMYFPTAFAIAALCWLGILLL
jgi:hypothetical protein